MSKSVVLILEPRFEDEYGEYTNIPVFNADKDIVGYVGGEVPESGNPCEFNMLGEEGFTFCASAAEIVRLKEENARLRELVKNMHGWLVVNHEKSYVIPLNGLNDIERDMRELGIEMDE